ncbi:EAL domain-containing protein [Massilia sp. R2A-15]|uniref:bifunctional diguanylate cyclase/phosphodiesterase n=1 Tax=Massilia sp. R2A-15 TaxID=3064278 RepID=UPI0027368308|nr:bifunctional diguanylate cyclase/phosphodiesterase [Massilia sp. R2A-15]WLI91403.1 EAL domain-containing protein [Massilia sp. R2A-15]
MKQPDLINANLDPPLVDQHFREFADSMPHILWTAEPDGTVDYLNKVYTDYTGVTLDVPSQSWLNALHPDDVERTIASWSEAIATGNVYSVEFRVIDIGTNEYRWQGVTAKPVRDEHGNIKKWYGIATDIHERKIADERANLLAARLDTTIEGMSDGFLMMDRTWHVIYLNRMAEKLMKRERSALLGKVIWDEFPELVDSVMYQECQLAVTQQRAVEFETLSEIFDNWFEVRIYPSADVVSVHFRDISSRKTAEAEIQRLAFYDQLTGLPNRQLLRDRLQHAMLVARRAHCIGAVIFIDLDNFKALNDTQGHHKGDLLLQELARRLATCVREIDTVARLGGDEFVVLLEDLSRDAAAAATQAELISEKVLAAVTEPCDLGDYHHTGTASIGVTLLDSECGGIDELLKRADLAMYRAKAAGRNAIRFYDPEMQTTIAAKTSLEMALRYSIKNMLFTLHYQPQLGADQRVIGAEALVRWSHPAHQQVPPSVFIPLAEETGLIHALGQWVMREACARLKAWATDAKTAQLSLAVNVSAYQFRHRDFVAGVLQAIHDSGANPGLLKLELTESALVNDMDDAVGKIEVLKEHGIRFSLDDFGTGYSSLSYLRFLPFEQLKIDRSFINRIPNDTKDAALVHAIIAMGHSLGLTVVAEGVETEQQRAFLAALGCDAYQGFLFSRPIDIGAFLRFLD